MPAKLREYARAHHRGARKRSHVHLCGPAPPLFRLWTVAHHIQQSCLIPLFSFACFVEQRLSQFTFACPLADHPPGRPDIIGQPCRSAKYPGHEFVYTRRTDDPASLITRDEMRNRVAEV